jgi:DNA-binding NtrC family response regulator
MTMESTLAFNEILEEIEALPEDDQSTLIDLLQRRRVERLRSEIAANYR